MALLAAGSLENVYAALDTYLVAQLVDTAGLALRLHGVRRFIPPIDDPWVEAHYDFLGLQSQFLRQTGGEIANVRRPGYDESVYGTERRGHLQINIYQRARVFRTRYTTAAMRDLVVNAFPDTTVIAVTDVAGGRPEEILGNVLTGDIVENVVDNGLHSGVIQHVVQIASRYIERYTRS